MRLGLGLAALGRPGYLNLDHAGDLGGDYAVDEMERRCHAVLDAALAAGVRHVDVARSYGRAEQFLADWLRARALAPGALTISSKWGYTYTAKWRAQAEIHEVKDHTLPTLERQLAESRALLGDHLSIYQIHSATRESGVLDDDAVLDELARVRAGGLAIGVTVTGPAQAETIRRALAIRRDGVPLFSWIHATWNVFERGAEAALAEAKAEGRQVIVKEALANGRLTAKNHAPEAAPLFGLAEKIGATPDALALAFALAQPGAHVVLSGAATALQFASNFGATSLVLDEETRVAIDSLRQTSAQYWSTRAQLAWS
ncbi:MAG TPA: aldo/keto reductase [Polyangia bacterium]